MDRQITCGIFVSTRIGCEKVLDFREDRGNEEKQAGWRRVVFEGAVKEGGYGVSLRWMGLMSNFGFWAR